MLIPCRAIGVGIGQNLLLSKLMTTVPAYTSAVSPFEVIAVGATGLGKIAPTLEILHELRLAYSEAVRSPLILALAAACFAFPFSCSMEWLNIKRVAEERKRQKAEIEEPTHQRPEKVNVALATEDGTTKTEAMGD
ncbi:hypothetical protein JX266_011200 [Neoarthrinium moseri]|nr:hypothetical protein JX266_011200 [Neoarthrinium moseri]